MTIQMISWQLIVLYLHKSPFIAYVNFVIGITITQLTKIGLCMKSKGKIKTSGIECQGVDSFRILQKWGSLPCWVVALWHSTLKWHWTFQISCSFSNLQPSSTSAVCKGRYCDCQRRQYKDNHTKRQRKCKDKKKTLIKQNHSLQDNVIVKFSWIILIGMVEIVIGQKKIWDDVNGSMSVCQILSGGGKANTVLTIQHISHN